MRADQKIPISLMGICVLYRRDPLTPLGCVTGLLDAHATSCILLLRLVPGSTRSSDGSQRSPLKPSAEVASARSSTSLRRSKLTSLSTITSRNHFVGAPPPTASSTNSPLHSINVMNLSFITLALFADLKGGLPHGIEDLGSHRFVFHGPCE